MGSGHTVSDVRVAQIEISHFCVNSTVVNVQISEYLAAACLHT